MTRIAFLLWPDTFDDWYDPLGVSREAYLSTYQGEWSIGLARALVGAGLDVHLVHGTLGPAEVATQRPSGATAHFVPAPLPYRGLRWAAWGHRHWERTQGLQRLAPVASTLSPRLVRHLVRLRPDVVVVQDYETLRYDVAAPLLRAAGLRVVAMDTGASARPSGAVWKPLTRRLSASLLAVHEAEARRLRGAGHRSVAVWPAPVRTDVLVPGDRSSARASLGIGADERVVFAAARLHPVKNLPLLADACADADARLVLAGEGTERPHLDRPHVTLLGWQDVEALVPWYAAADVVALSSNTEGQPLAVLEAFACGRAVVATAVGGVPEVVRPGETGWLVPPRDRVALATALREALADRTATDALGAAGRGRVLREHAPDAVAAAFRSL
ncbi:MAG: glycosyltransferase family 4 protein [Mycobacteriales bacterium]